MNRKICLGLFVLVLTFHLNAFADQTFKTSGSNEVQFVAKITGGSFVAKSKEVTGSALIDDAGKKILSMEFTVPVQSLDSGISLRNNHMQNKYLEKEKFPMITFALKTPIEIKPGTSNTIPGEFVIKGVTKSCSIPVTINQTNPTKIRLESDFPIVITDYDIEQPGFAVVKMDTTVKVHTNLNLERKP